MRVTIHIRDVPQGIEKKEPIVLFSLFQHEHKKSVLHFTVQRNTEYDGSVRSKVIDPSSPRQNRWLTKIIINF